MLGILAGTGLPTVGMTNFFSGWPLSLAARSGTRWPRGFEGIQKLLRLGPAGDADSGLEKPRDVACQLESLVQV